MLVSGKIKSFHIENNCIYHMILDDYYTEFRLLYYKCTQIYSDGNIYFIITDYPGEYMLLSIDAPIEGIPIINVIMDDDKLYIPSRYIAKIFKDDKSKIIQFSKSDTANMMVAKMLTTASYDVAKQLYNLLRLTEYKYSLYLS